MIFNPNVMAAAGGSGGAVVGTYIGDGSASRSLTFDFEPAFVVIMSAEGHETMTINAGRASIGVTFAAKTGLASMSNPTVEFSGKTATFSGLSGLEGKALNTSNKTYTYVAIPKA